VNHCIRLTESEVDITDIVYCLDKTRLDRGAVYSLLGKPSEEAVYSLVEIEASITEITCCS
jgi:hypothetical protein